MPTTTEPTNTTTTTEAALNTRYKCHLISPSKLKGYIRLRVKQLRPAWGVKRVSDSLLIDCENAVKRVVEDTVRRHPSKGTVIKSLNV